MADTLVRRAPPSVAGDDPRPLAGYAALLVVCGAVVGLSPLGLRRRRHRARSMSAMDVGLMALATAHLSRLITKVSVTSVLRGPFARFEEPAGEGEVNEEAVGSG
ncbi:MAG TPA: hypothetical protein DCQ30_13365 [Acidimicrobiaceae bacterium]|nr:hypothetical protein [Acidimicrobiaceae bacterium]